MEHDTSFDTYLRYYRNQSGGAYPINIYKGARFQRGYGLGSLFASFVRAISPIFTSQGFQQAAKKVGKRALTAGVNIGSDILAGDDFRQSLKKHATGAASDIYEDAREAVRRSMATNQSGSGKRKRRRKSIKAVDTKKKKTVRKSGSKQTKKAKQLKKQKQKKKTTASRLKSVRGKKRQTKKKSCGTKGKKKCGARKGKQAEINQLKKQLQFLRGKSFSCKYPRFY
jgi:hypothetical protein